MFESSQCQLIVWDRKSLINNNQMVINHKSLACFYICLLAQHRSWVEKIDDIFIYVWYWWMYAAECLSLLWLASHANFLSATSLTVWAAQLLYRHGCRYALVDTDKEKIIINAVSLTKSIINSIAICHQGKTYNLAMLMSVFITLFLISMMKFCHLSEISPECQGINNLDNGTAVSPTPSYTQNCYFWLTLSHYMVIYLCQFNYKSHLLLFFTRLYDIAYIKPHHMSW